MTTDGLRPGARTAWITGAGRGLGRELALAFARAGSCVALMSRSAKELAAVANEVVQLGGTALVLEGTVSDPQSVNRCAQAILERFGRIDSLVNNAGVSPSYVRSEFAELDDWNAVLSTNLTGAFLCAQAAGRAMLERESGSIVNISSVHGQVGGQRLAAYSASKGGLELLTKTLSVEWADRGVRVNSVAPGYFRTSMTDRMLSSPTLAPALLSKIPLSRFGTTSDVAAAVMFLCSDSANYITGASLNVDGGWCAQ